MKYLFIDTMFEQCHYIFSPVKAAARWGLRWYRDFDGTVVVYIDWSTQK